MENIEELKLEFSILDKKNKKEFKLFITILLLFIISIICVIIFSDFTFLQIIIPIGIIIYIISYFFRNLPKNDEVARKLQDTIRCKEILEGQTFDAELKLIDGNVIKGTFYKVTLNFEDITDVNTNTIYIRENIISIKYI